MAVGGWSDDAWLLTGCGLPLAGHGAALEVGDQLAGAWVRAFVFLFWFIYLF